MKLEHFKKEIKKNKQIEERKSINKRMLNYCDKTCGYTGLPPKNTFLGAYQGYGKENFLFNYYIYYNSNYIYAYIEMDKDKRYHFTISYIRDYS